MSTILRLGSQLLYIPDVVDDVAELIPALSVARACRDESDDLGNRRIVIDAQPIEIGIRSVDPETPIVRSLNRSEKGGAE